MKVRIYQPSKAATQSGLSSTQDWILEYDLPTGRKPEPLMGWTASGDTMNQVRLKFSSLDEARDYAERERLNYIVQMPHTRRVTPRNYADNFKYVPVDEKK